MHRYQQFALGALAILLSACGQSAQAPAPADGDAAATGAVEIPMDYQASPNPHGRNVWFVCDVLMSPTIYVGMTPDESGAFQLIEYERGNATPVSTKTNRLFASPQVDDAYRLTFHQDDTDGLIIFSTRIADGWTVPIDSYGIEMTADSCRIYPRTYVTGFTAKRSFVIRDAGSGNNEELEYLGFDAATWQDATLEEQPDGTRTTSASVRAAGAMVSQGDVLQWDFPAGSAYTYRVSSRIGGDATLEVLRDGAVISSEPIIAMQTGARR